MKKFTNSTAILFLAVLNLFIFTASQAYSEEPGPAQAPSPAQFKKSLEKEDFSDEKSLPVKETLEQKYERIRKKLPKINMVFVKGGCFRMGDWTDEGDDDERPAHEVCVSDYYIGETVVTRGLYFTVMDREQPKDPDKPVTYVNYVQALRFINTLNAITKGFYRLPTEAEWEYAARSRGKNELWPGLNNEAELKDYAWFADDSNNEVHPVRQKKPNGFGLYDIVGNVWQWTADAFDFDFYKKGSKQDPLNDSFSQWHTARGGSAFDNAFKLRTTYRYGFEPVTKSGIIGFRLAE